MIAPSPAIRVRYPLLAGGGVALLAGLYAGLVRLGLPVSEPAEGAAGVHGALLVFGFVGTLIALERAIALGASWAMLAPASAAAGGAALVIGAATAAGSVVTGGKVLLAAAAALLVAVYIPLWRRQPGPAVLAQAAGAFAWYAAALLWLGGFAVAEILPWMTAFVALTIAGERLELAGIVHRKSHVDRLAIVTTAVVVAGAATSTLWPDAGTRVWGLAVLVAAGTAFATDMARRLARADGLPRYVALAVVAGYGWLALAGLLWSGAGSVTAGPRYDATVHAVFLGFTLSMIFAHAPVILPAVLRRPLPYHPVLYAPLAVLHLSLLARVGLGDLGGSDLAWQLSGVVNEAAVVGFVGCAVALVLRGGRRDRDGPRPRIRATVEAAAR